jgi:hypothetical protein
MSLSITTKRCFSVASTHLDRGRSANGWRVKRNQATHPSLGATVDAECDIGESPLFVSGLEFHTSTTGAPVFDSAAGGREKTERTERGGGRGAGDRRDALTQDGDRRQTPPISPVRDTTELTPQPKPGIGIM